MPEETSLALDAQESAAQGADMDGFDGDAFLSALGVEEGGGDQAAQTDAGAENAAPADGGDQTGGEAEPEKPEEQQQPAEAGAPAQVLTMRSMDKSYALPAGAVGEVARALGVTPEAAVALMQKGMNYDNKGAREARLLQGLAQSAGLDYNAFLAKAEGEQRELRVRAEMLKVAATLPEGTPEAALRQIAESNLASQRAREQIEAAKSRMRQESDAQNARVEPFRELLRARPDIKRREDIPQAAWELIGKGMHPLSAVLQAERDALTREKEELSRQLEAAKKNNRNRQQAAGSMASGAAAEDDPFLAALLS